MPSQTVHNEIKLHIIKTIHTIAWAVFASCILAIPVFVYFAQKTVTLTLVSVVLVEVVILVINGMKCPLTGVAARYTQDRSGNFDIYLPNRLATYNKVIFGTLFVMDILFMFLYWYI